MNRQKAGEVVDHTVVIGNCRWIPWIVGGACVTCCGMDVNHAANGIPLVESTDRAPVDHLGSTGLNV